MEKTSESPAEVHAPPRWLDLRPLGLIAIAIAGVIATGKVMDTYYSVKVRPEVRTINVVGSAKKRIVSDLIEWSATVQATNVDRTEAYKSLRDGREKTVAFLVGQGVKAEEIQPQSTTFEDVWDTSEEYKMFPGAKEAVKVEKKTFSHYAVSEVIIVRSTDVQRVEKASREVTSLLEQGISITSSAPSYFYTRLGELKVEMLAAAGKDARARADNILKSTGGASIKRMIDANMGIININPANSTETSAEGNNDRSSYEKDIITIVRAEFELQ